MLIGGLGHRKKKPKDGEEKFEPPGVFKRLGINMTNAIVRNAKAKIIERRFEDVKNDLSRLFNTYTGGSVVEKPERLKFVLKKEQIYTDEEFEEYVTAVLEWYFNMEAYNGAVEADKGKCKTDVFNEHLKRKRVASAEELNPNGGFHDRKHHRSGSSGHCRSSTRYRNGGFCTGSGIQYDFL